MSYFRSLISAVLLFVAVNTTAAIKDAPPTIPADMQMRKQALANSAKVSLFQLFDVFPGTKSNQYQWLENLTPQRGEFLDKTKFEAQQKLSNLSQQEKIKQFLMPTPQESEIDESEVKISETRQIKIMKKDFVRTIYDIEGDTKTTLFSNQDFEGKQAFFHGLFASPDNKYVGIVIALNGTIDNVLVKIYDVTQKIFITEFECFSGDFAMHWYSNSQVIYTHAQTSSKGETTVIQNVVTGEKVFKINHGMINFDDWNGYQDYGTDDVFLQNIKTGETLVYKALPLGNFIAQTDTHFYILDSYNKDLSGGIYTLEKLNLGLFETFAKPIENTHLAHIEILKRQGLSDVLAAQYTRDGMATVIIYNLDGTIERSAKLPANLWLTSVSFDSVSQSYKADVTNVHGNATELVWPLSEKILKIPEETYAPKKDSEFEMVSRIEYFKSADGELIPARITHKKDLLITASNAVFMEAYGGFMLAGYLAPVKSKMALQFIKRGGIVVGTGLRGGSERGYAWYEAGVGKNKINTSLDLIAIADGLVERGYTQAKKIVISGTSNGGYVTASAGRLSPESFGLVIPINGVQDQLDFSSLDRWGIGWESNYLNPYDSKNFSLNYARSPLEVKFQSQTGAEFLIINGENDTRVNKVHSYKLKALMDDYAPGKSILFSVEKAGHWPVSTYLIDDIGIHANSVMWAKIFDFVGMEF